MLMLAENLLLELKISLFTALLLRHSTSPVLPAAFSSTFSQKGNSFVVR